MPPAPKQPTVVDPDSIPETLCDGRVNIYAHGNLATLTFTHARPRAAVIFSGTVEMEEVVRARITMTIDNFAALRNLLNDTIKDGGAQIPPGGAASPTKH